MEGIATTATAVTNGMNAGLKGSALTEMVKSTVGGPLSTAGALRAVLNHVSDFSANWYDMEEYGDVLVNSYHGNIEEQIAELNEIQDYCHSKGFPKVEIKGKERKLIQLIISKLIETAVIDFHGIFAWEEDTTENGYAGRAEAMRHVSGMLATFHAIVDEELSDVEPDLFEKDL